MRQLIARILLYFLKERIETIASLQVQLHEYAFHAPITEEQRKHLDKKFPGIFL